MLSGADRLLLKNGAEKLTVTLDSIAIDRFEIFADRLHEANQHINLTRVPAEQTVTLHFLDSLAIACAVQIDAVTTVLDMGTGAGFPGIPLAIAYPELRLTLVDATQKRLSFIEGVISELHLDNVRLVHGRAEALSRSELCGAFDVVTARAVANMEQLAGWLIPYVAPGGCAIAFKSLNAKSEIESATDAIKLMGGELERIEEVKLPGTDIIRLFAIISVNNRPSKLGKHDTGKLRSLKHPGLEKKEIR